MLLVLETSPVKNFAWIIFSSFLISCPWGFAQSPNALGARNVQDYFQDVESKSYYQQERIRSMKGEMNEYSKRLHGLQEKFHKIFYGRSSDRLHKDPFGNRDKISYPKRSYREPMPMKEVESIVRRPEKFSEQKSESNQLAFNVDESGPPNYIVEQELALADSPSTPFEQEYEEPYTPEPEPSGIPESYGMPKKDPANDGVYLILRPGITFPYSTKVKKVSPGKEKQRKYKPGEMVTFSGGYDWGRFFIGGGALYRRNEHDNFPHSYEMNSGDKKPFNDNSNSMSVAGFIEFGMELPLSDSFNFIGDLGLGYGVSFVEDFSPGHVPYNTNRTRVDPFFFGSAGLGFSWEPTDHFALQLGYKYLYENEVPAHAAQIGLKGNF